MIGIFNKEREKRRKTKKKLDWLQNIYYVVKTTTDGGCITMGETMIKGEPSKR